MDEELAIIQREQEKIENKKLSKSVAILKQTLEPVESKLEDVSESIDTLISFFNKVTTSNPEYFDKKFNENISSSIDKLFNLLKNFKQSEIKIDLSPISSIATEMKNQNIAILALLNKPNQSVDLYKMIVSMVAKQNATFDKLSEIKNTPQINQPIEKEKPKEWEFKIERSNQYGSNFISKVIATSK
jgi:hypothetical protein